VWARLFLLHFDGHVQMALDESPLFRQALWRVVADQLLASPYAIAIAKGIHVTYVWHDTLYMADSGLVYLKAWASHTDQ